MTTAVRQYTCLCSDACLFSGTSETSWGRMMPMSASMTCQMLPGCMPSPICQRVFVSMHYTISQHICATPCSSLIMYDVCNALPEPCQTLLAVLPLQSASQPGKSSKGTPPTVHMLLHKLNDLSGSLVLAEASNRCAAVWAVASLLCSPTLPNDVQVATGAPAAQHIQFVARHHTN